MGLGEYSRSQHLWYDNPGTSKDQLSNHTQLTAYWYVLLVLVTFPVSISYAVMEFDKFSVFSNEASSTSRVVIAQRVAVTAKNLINSSETLCTDEDSACLFS